jgi:hypothetical protein
LDPRIDHDPGFFVRVKVQRLQPLNQLRDAHLFVEVDREQRRVLAVSTCDHLIPRLLGRRLHQSCQCGLYCGAEISIAEVRATQSQPGGNALKEYAALLHRRAAGGGHDHSKLIV